MTGILLFTDTRSGYRFITAEVLQGLPLRAVGYEMERELLRKACKRADTVVDISVATQYSNGRPSSHFRLVRDSSLVCRIFVQARLGRHYGNL